MTPLNPGGDEHFHVPADRGPQEGSSAGEHLPLSHLTVVREAVPNADEALIERVSRKAPGSLEALYHALSPRLYSIALNLLRNPEDASEALQDTFIRIWEKAPSYDAAKSKAFSWMVMILRGHCLDRMRKRKLRAPVWEDWDSVQHNPARNQADDDRAASMASPGDDFLTAQTLEEVRQAFALLPVSEQKLVWDALFSPGSLDDLATTMAQPLTTVKSRLHRAILKLRTLLKWDQ